MSKKLTGLLLFVAVASAGPIKFSGTASVSAEQDFVSGDSGPSPTSNVGLRINPVLTIFGMPLSVDLLLSSQESNLRQALNKYRIFLQPKELLRSMVNLPGLVFSIRGIEIGTCTPSYSPLTLSGISVLGGAVELNPWYIYLAGAAGRSQRAVEGSDTTEPAYARMLYAGKFGFGKKEGTHCYFTFLRANDDPNSIRHNVGLLDTVVVGNDTIVDSIETITPQENYVLGTELNFVLFDSVLTVESEIDGAELTRDNRLPVMSYSWLPDWVENTLHPRLSSQFDYAWAVRPTLNVFDGRLYGSVKMVGPGYQSLGAPSLRKDNFTYEVGAERGFADDQLLVAASCTREHDNLIGTKLSTTSFTSLVLSASLSIRELPYIQVGYTPCFQQSSDQSDRTQIVSLSTGYSFDAGGLSHSPGISTSYQNYSSSAAEDNYTGLDIGLSYGLGFQSPLALSACTGWAQTVYSDKTEQTVYAEVSPSYTLFRSWTNSLSLGASLAAQGNRADARLNSSFPVWRIADGNVSVEQSFYRGSDASYDELRLSSGLSRSW